MRPIKFRYKFEVAGEIIYEIYTLDDIEDGKVKDYCYTWDAEVLSRNQFIGFSDEGGREIYEGDEIWFPITGVRGEIEWHDKSGKFICRDKHGAWSSFIGGERMMVIGEDE